MDAAETLSCASLGSCAQDAGNVPEKLLVDTSTDSKLAIWLQVLGNVPTHHYWTSIREHIQDGWYRHWLHP